MINRESPFLFSIVFRILKIPLHLIIWNSILSSPATSTASQPAPAISSFWTIVSSKICEASVSCPLSLVIAPQSCRYLFWNSFGFSISFFLSFSSLFCDLLVYCWNLELCVCKWQKKFDLRCSLMFHPLQFILSFLRTCGVFFLILCNVYQREGVWLFCLFQFKS